MRVNGIFHSPSGKFKNDFSLFNAAQVLRKEFLREEGISVEKKYTDFMDETINEHKSGAFVKMHKRQLSDHSQKGRLLPTIQGKVKNKRNLFNTNFSIE